MLCYLQWHFLIQVSGNTFLLLHQSLSFSKLYLYICTASTYDSYYMRGKKHKSPWWSFIGWCGAAWCKAVLLFIWLQWFSTSYLKKKIIKAHWEIINAAHESTERGIYLKFGFRSQILECGSNGLFLVGLISCD